MKRLFVAAATVLSMPVMALAYEPEEIVVTAIKRGGVSAQDPPIALNVFDAQDLRERNVEDLTSLSNINPVGRLSAPTEDA